MKTKTIALLLAVALVFGGVIGGTIAWLTAESENVINTFTVGDINISLAETVDKEFKIVPGATDKKDPFVTVEKGSEKCYVYVKITNDLVINGETVVTYNISADWIEVGRNGNTVLYRYNGIVDASAGDVTKVVFTEVTYDDEITKDNIDALNNKTIVLQAYAYQSENTDITDANDAASLWAGITAP